MYSMRLRISILLICLLASFQLAAQETEISFKIKNAGVFVDGTFDSIRVIQNFNPQNLASAQFEAVIPISTIDTGIKARDRHLLKEKYFDVENYPEITFRSSEVKRAEGGYQLKGSLTIKETTLPVSIDFKLEEIEGTPYYMGSLELDRRDYGVGKNHLILGDMVRISIKVPAKNPGI